MAAIRPDAQTPPPVPPSPEPHPLPAPTHNVHRLYGEGGTAGGFDGSIFAVEANAALRGIREKTGPPYRPLTNAARARHRPPGLSSRAPRTVQRCTGPKRLPGAGDGHPPVAGSPPAVVRAITAASAPPARPGSGRPLAAGAVFICTEQAISPVQNAARFHVFQGLKTMPRRLLFSPIIRDRRRRNISVLFGLKTQTAPAGPGLANPTQNLGSVVGRTSPNFTRR